MKLLEILLHELENWPEGKEYAFQSAISSVAYFESSDEDEDPKAISLCQISSERGIENKVTREEWQTAMVKSLQFFKDVSAILGEEGAVKELLAVSTINYTAQELDEAFVFSDTPQGFEFWSKIAEPNREGKELREAFNTITDAMRNANPEYFIRLQHDGSGSVRDQDDNEIFYFHNTDSLVNTYLSPPPKFDHWDLLNDQFKWIAKDLNGSWWAYEVRPSLAALGWTANGECRSLEIMKVDIPCHWEHSLIMRPSRKD